MNSYRIWNLADPGGPHLSLKDEFKADKVRTFMKQFILTDEDVNCLKILFDKELNEGLQTDKTSTPANVSKMAVDVTYFTESFNGTENGDYVIINLTAQNLVLALATVKPGFPVKTVRKYFIVDENMRRSPYIKIFEYLCDCILIFFKENNLLKKLQILGFSTDLPKIQFSINDAIINYFTMTASDFPLNSYDIRKCFGIVLLKECYKDIRFILIAIMSNNMSLLINSSYVYGPVDIFINLENDCDLIYQEDVKLLQKWNSENSKAEKVFIDTELRNFGRSGTLNFITTDLDWSVILEPISWTHADKECRLEKFLSEKHVLELIRRILMTLHHELLYCRGGDVGRLYEVNGVSRSDVITIDNIQDLDQASQLLPGGSIGISNEDALIAKYVCKMVLIRSALLLSICLSNILGRLSKTDFITVIKSPLLEKHWSYQIYIRNFLQVLAIKKKMQFYKVKDEILEEGIALATSVINRQRKEQDDH